VKRIGVVSDTHGYLDQNILNYLSECDEVWHAGDWGTIDISDKLKALKKVRGVWGNIDGRELRISYPENNLFECEGIKVLITHIAGYPGKYTTRVKKLIQVHKPGIVVCGHSHILKVIFDIGFNHLHLNPGASGIIGFHQVRTLLRFTIDKSRPKELEIVELGKRF
jgi:putative phosphoesterase